MKRFVGCLAAAVCVGAATADSISTYEGFPEGFLGTSFSDNGVSYRDANLQGGVFPDGSTFTPADLGSEFIIENANFFYDSFPSYGSRKNCLTFGSAFIPGDNLSIGALSSIWMDLDQPATAAQLDIAYYENGPWGGIVYHLDGLSGGSVVASDSFVLSNLGGRDNATFSTMSIGGATFDTLHLYATFGDQYSGPRGMIDDLTLTSVPACPADVDHDGDVDLSDLGVVLSAYGSCKGDAGFVEAVDFDASGCIDLSDLGVTLSAYGIPCP